MLKLKLGGTGYQHIKHSALCFDFFLCSRPTMVSSLTLQKLIKIPPPKPNPLPGQAEATSSPGSRSLDKQLSFPSQSTLEEALSDFKLPPVRLTWSCTDVTRRLISPKLTRDIQVQNRPHVPQVWRRWWNKPKHFPRHPWGDRRCAPSCGHRARWTEEALTKENLTN